MYLKKIVASGFKSFADKIVIDFTEGITGIVGPNGSGKSNVVDAIRWVLGEQSVKSLRGDGNMSDVIFSGSKSRKSQNVASVTLVFDNQDKYLPLDYLEVELKRRVYRDGTNEYFINGEKCRLKDIYDLLLDTGIAKESFNIISQGKVDEIISNKPSERRIIFEEAAGVLKYKKRKEEALRKLEKTHNNMNRVNDIISELELQVNPLKEQRDKALIYKEKNEELEKIELALITTEITDLNYQYQNSKEKCEKLSNEIIKSETENSTNQAKIEKYKKDITKLDTDINLLQEQFTKQIEIVERANSNKNIILERKKYETEDTKLHDNLISLKENKLKLENDINKLQIEINSKKQQSEDVLKNYKNLEEVLLKEKNSKQKLEHLLNQKIVDKNSIENKINYLKESIENNSLLPSSVREVLNNPKLGGIHDTIGNIIEVEEKYSTAITTSLSSATNNVIVDNEIKAKEAIQYLKNNNLGRVTFFPLNIIKPRFILTDILSKINSLEGFIDIASNLVKNHPIYNDIISNQLGNVIVVDNIDNANIISKAINHTYKVVTLDGTLLHIGGSLTGGTINRQKNTITEKYELEKYLKILNKIVDEIKEIENSINDSDYNYRQLEDKLYLVNKKRINLEEEISLKNNFINNMKEKLINITNEKISVEKLVKNEQANEEDEALDEYYKELNEKNKIEVELNQIKNKKNSLSFDLKEFEDYVKKENSIYSSKSKELRQLEIDVNRMDVKLDTLLNKLSETYNITYEKAKEEYRLEINIEEAKQKVSSLKRIIQDLGIINLNAIEEYEKVNERYQFLNSQRDDLTKAEDTLLEIIKEMDQVMIFEFEKSFKTINEKFKETFRELFKGGNAELKLTNPEDMLETGIEIVASPPGKSLKSISLLSGGEKTFTAISLLFAILKSREVPFCVLDEVEAALDEANVDGFGEYITNLKNKTQFILITHKKKTMEYADVLYGITMQESGISKLVSVRLEDFKN